MCPLPQLRLIDSDRGHPCLFLRKTYTLQAPSSFPSRLADSMIGYPPGKPFRAGGLGTVN